MKVSHYIAIGFRILSICLFLYALKNAVTYISYSYSGLEGSLWMFAGSTVVTFSIAALLWFFPLSVASVFVREDFDHEVRAIGVHDLATVLVACIGLFYFYYAFSDAAYWATYMHLLSGSEGYVGEYSPNEIENRTAIYVTGMELILALVMILWSRSIASFILRLSK